MSEPILLNSAQMASFVARGFLRFDAAVPADINAQFMAEAGEVPELAAGIRSGRACAKAPRITSVMRCEVSTLPAAIAAGNPALTTLRSGAMTLMGRNNPALYGTSARIRQRKQYIAAATAIA